MVEVLERRMLLSTGTLTLTNNPVTIGDTTPFDNTPPLYGLTSFRGALLYVNDDGAHGSELYRSDGTQAGTVLIKDINPGPKSSAIGALSYSNENAAPFVFRNVAYFTADDGVHRDALWRTDGTTTGTYMVRDFSAPSTTDLGTIPGSKPEHFVAAGNVLFFECTSPSSDRPEVWRTDGTSAGTFRISDTVSVKISDYTGPRAPASAAIGSTLYFVHQGFDGVELWKSDGTLAGTMKIATDPLLTNTSLYASGNQLFMLDRPHNRLFAYVPGTAAPTLVADIPMPFDTGYVYYKNVTALNGRILFDVEFQPRISGNHVAQVWVSNGTAAGTRSLIGDTYDNYTKGDPFGAPVVVGGTAYFPVGQALWKTDGTRGGTVAVHPFAKLNLWPTNLFASADGVYFETGHESTAQLWKSNGTDAGTVKVTDLSAATPINDPDYTLVANRLYYFRADVVRQSEVTSIDLSSPGGAPQQIRGVVLQIGYSPRKRRLYVTGSQYSDRLTVAANLKRGRLTVTYDGLARIFRLADIRSVVVSGGAGADVVTIFGPVPARLYGEDDNDVLTGGDGDDLLDGGAGADHLLGGAGDDDLQGGGDYIVNQYEDWGGDTLDGGLGADHLSGGPGYKDTLDYSARTAGVTVSTDGRGHDGAPGERDNVAGDFETILGGAGDDYLVESGVEFVALYGNGGNDTLVGDADALYGGAGNDLLTGARRAKAGNSYDGGAGSDTLIGTARADYFASIDGEVDRIFGNGGDDNAHVDRHRDKLDSVKSVFYT
jgi:ELWxxDGT repeat protein